MLVVKNRLPMQEMQEIRSLGQEDPLEEEMAAHSSVLAWRIPWTEEPGGLQSVGSQESRTRLKRLSTRRRTEPGGCSWGLHARILSAWSNTASCEIQLRRGYPFDSSRWEYTWPLSLVHIPHSSAFFSFPNNASAYFVNYLPKTKLYSHASGSQIPVYEQIVLASSDSPGELLSCPSRRFCFRRSGISLSIVVLIAFWVILIYLRLESQWVWSIFFLRVSFQ